MKVEYCKFCHSIIVEEKCSNKRCSSKKLTLRQEQEINRLCFCLGENIKEYLTTPNITQKKASKIIEKLTKRAGE